MPSLVLASSSRDTDDLEITSRFCWKILTEPPQGAGAAAAGREEGLPGAFGAAPTPGSRSQAIFPTKPVEYLKLSWTGATTVGHNGQTPVALTARLARPKVKQGQATNAG